MTSANEEKVIGYSLSFCVGDILRGRVNEELVSHIVASTKAATPQEFDELLDSYGRTYWSSDPETGKAIARRLYDAGKIDQPRLRGEDFMHVGNGHWKVVEPGKASAAPVKDDSHAGLYDPAAVNSADIQKWNLVTTLVASIHEGTKAPITVKRIRLKGPK